MACQVLIERLRKWQQFLSVEQTQRMIKVSVFFIYLFSTVSEPSLSFLKCKDDLEACSGNPGEWKSWQA